MMTVSYFWRFWERGSPTKYSTKYYEFSWHLHVFCGVTMNKLLWRFNTWHKFCALHRQRLYTITLSKKSVSSGMFMVRYWYLGFQSIENTHFKYFSFMLIRYHHTIGYFYPCQRGGGWKWKNCLNYVHNMVLHPILSQNWVKFSDHWVPCMDAKGTFSICTLGGCEWFWVGI